MNFKIIYHPLVASNDIPKLSSAYKNKIRKTIETRLTEQPDFYGKPLRKSLKGYRKLRVEDYRVIFKINNQTVQILMIEDRSIVYRKISKRS